MTHKRFSGKLLAMTLVLILLMQIFAILPVSAIGTEAPAGTAPTTIERRMTPIMGWASWNKYRCNINEELLLSQIDALIETGLAEAGYEFFNIDDGYFDGRDPVTNRVNYNKEKFPNGMKYIADYAHSKGLKAGCYTDAGENTCGSVSDGQVPQGIGVGLYGYDELDLRMYLAEWGFDFIKVDWCGGRDHNPPLNKQERYTKISQVINEIEQEIGQDKIYNVCCWGFPGEWVVDIADSWRTGGDISPNFSSVLYQLNQIRTLAKYNGPGHVNDLDMMQVGNGMTYEEDKSHFSMWCMMSTPLMLGNDLTTISQETLDIVTNKELIALNQDPACIQATVAKEENGGQIWEKALGSADSNTKAVALLNTTNAPLTMTVNWKDVGLAGQVTARDLWAHQDLVVGDSYTITLPAHGVAVLKVTGEAPISNATLKSNLSAKPAEVNLTEEGSVDWSYFAKEESKANGSVIGDYTISENADISIYDNSGTSYSWSDGEKDTSASGVTKGVKITGNGATCDLTLDASEDEQTAKVYFGGSNALINVTAILDGKQTTETIQAAEGMGGLYTVKYASSKENSKLTLRISVEGEGSANIEAVAVGTNATGSGTVEINAKPTAINLTELGSSDWAYFGACQGVSVHHKANGGNTISLKTNGESSGSYSNAACTYSWTDGAEVRDNSAGVKTGIGVVHPGAYAEISAPADEIERTLYVSVGGYSSNFKVQVWVGNTLVDEQLVEGVQRGKTDRLVQVTYSADEPTQVRVRWTVVSEFSDNNGSISIEAAALQAAQDIQNILYTSTAPISGTVDLEKEGTLDYVSFGGNHGDIAFTKNGVLSDYVTSDDASVERAESNVLYTADGMNASAGAGQTSNRDYFELYLPAKSSLTKANIYFGIKDVDASITVEKDGNVLTESAYDIQGGQDKVLSIWYSGFQDVKITFTLKSSFTKNSQIRLDAIALSDAAGNIVSYPTVVETDGQLQVKANTVAVEGSPETARFIAALYDAEGYFHSMRETEVAFGGEIENSIPVPEGFDGTVRLYLWDADSSLNAPLGEAYTYMLPLQQDTEVSDPAYIGNLKARDLVANGAILLDVRTKAEYEAGHIEGAINISHTDILEKAEEILPDKSTDIIVYCATAKRSSQAQMLLMYMGYQNVYNIGNMANWYIEPKITISAPKHMLREGEAISAIYSANVYDDLKLYYSNGVDSTFADSIKTDTGIIPASLEGYSKVYLVYNGTVYMTAETAYDVFVPPVIPDVELNVFLSEMPWKSATTGWGSIKRNASVDGNPLSIGGNKFEKGIGTHATSEIVAEIPEGATRFIAVGGVDDETFSNTSWSGYTLTKYAIYIDDVLMEESTELNVGMYHVFDIEIPEGAKEIKLVADETADGDSYDHSDWGIAGFVAPNVGGEDDIDVYITDLEWPTASVGWGKIMHNVTVDGNVMSIGGVPYLKGVGIHADSVIEMAIPEGSEKFVAVAGLDDEANSTSATMYFEVYIDGELADSSGNIKMGTAYPFNITIPDGAKTIKLVANSALSNINFCHADWANAGFILKK